MFYAVLVILQPSNGLRTHSVFDTEHYIIYLWDYALLNLSLRFATAQTEVDFDNDHILTCLWHCTLTWKHFIFSFLCYLCLINLIKSLLDTSLFSFCFIYSVLYILLNNPVLIRYFALMIISWTLRFNNYDFDTEHYYFIGLNYTLDSTYFILNN